jgi:hypothetical protein
MNPLPILLALLFTPLLHADNKHTPPPPFESSLPWLTDLDDALAAAKKTGRPILVEFR